MSIELQPGDYCAYSLKHAMDRVPAVVVIQVGAVGPVAVCQACADFYARQSGSPVADAPALLVRQAFECEHDHTEEGDA